MCQWLNTCGSNALQDAAGQSLSCAMGEPANNASGSQEEDSRYENRSAAEDIRERTNERHEYRSNQ
jgi:hypothetical protein